MESRQIIIDRKLDAINQKNLDKRSNHMCSIQAAIQSCEDLQSNEEKKAADENLSPRQKRRLMSLGVSMNTAQMLQLTTVNGTPVKRDPKNDQLNLSNDYVDPELAFKPSLAQLKAMDYIIEQRKRHPIMWMRQKAQQLEHMQKQSSRSPPRSPQSTSIMVDSPQKQQGVIRSITFFNSGQAEQKRKIDLNERKQVFKLLPSVSKATSLLPVEQNLIKLSNILPDQMTPQSCRQLGFEDTFQQVSASNSKANPFASLGSSTSINAKGLVAAAISSTNLKQQLRDERRTASPTCPAKNSPHNASAQRILSMPQSCLYHSSKLSKVQMGNEHTLKQVIRHQLTKSLNSMPESLYNSRASNCNRGGTYQAQFSDQTSSMQIFNNSDNQAMSIEPTALFSEDEVQELQLQSQTTQNQQQQTLNSQTTYQNRNDEETQNSQFDRRFSLQSKQIDPRITCEFRLDLSNISNQQRASFAAQQTNFGIITTDYTDHRQQYESRINTELDMSRDEVINVTESEQSLTTKSKSRKSVVLSQMKNVNSQQQSSSQYESQAMQEADSSARKNESVDFKVDRNTQRDISMTTSSNGASVLLEIEQTEKSFGLMTQNQLKVQVEDQKPRPEYKLSTQPQCEEQKASLSSCVAVIHDILSDRKRQMFSQEMMSPSQIKAQKKVKRFQTINAVPSSTKKMLKGMKQLNISPKNALPPIKSSVFRQTIPSTTNFQLRASLPNPLNRCSQRDDYYEQEGRLLGKISSSVEALGERGLSISKVSLRPKPYNKAGTILNQNHLRIQQSIDTSRLSSQLLEQTFNEDSQQGELEEINNSDINLSSRLERLKPRFTSLAIKQLKAAQQQSHPLTQTIEGRSYHKQSGTSSPIPQDLRSVMDNKLFIEKDINFIKIKSKHNVRQPIGQKLWPRMHFHQHHHKLQPKYLSIEAVSGFNKNIPQQEQHLKIAEIDVEQVNLKSPTNLKERNNDLKGFPSITVDDSQKQQYYVSLKREKQDSTLLNRAPAQDVATERNPLFSNKSASQRGESCQSREQQKLHREVNEQMMTLDQVPMKNVTHIKVSIDQAGSPLKAKEKAHLSPKSKHKIAQQNKNKQSHGLKKWVQDRAKELAESSHSSPQSLKQVGFDQEPWSVEVLCSDLFAKEIDKQAPYETNSLSINKSSQVVKKRVQSLHDDIQLKEAQVNSMQILNNEEEINRRQILSQEGGVIQIVQNF